MAVNYLSTEAMEALAIRRGLKLAIDPFHGAAAYEFQKEVDKGTCCAGVIIGPEATTLYTRSVNGRQTENYREFETVANVAFDMTILCKFISDQLG